MPQRAVICRPNFKLEMPPKVFAGFAAFIYELCGVSLPPVKNTMLSARLSKRMRCLGFSSFQDYYDYVTGPKGFSEESEQMINAVTTNKTDFFREPGHFEYLIHTVLPEVLKMRRISNLSRLTIWSAGCSSGEEPFTLAMILSEFFNGRQGDFIILATDISTRVLDIAIDGIYSSETIRPVPDPFKRKYLMRGTGRRHGLFRVVPELRERVVFRKLNLLEKSDFGISEKMDIIFCRNVMIYFDRRTQISLFRKFYAQLRPGGFIFLGHSETLNNINSDFEALQNSVYRKPME